MAVIEGMWRLLRVCGGYNRYVAVIIGIMRLLLVCGGYIGMWRLCRYAAVM